MGIFKQISEQGTLRSLIHLFRKTYGLGVFDLAHESVHAATGYDVTLADELRVDILTSAMEGYTFDQAKDCVHRLYAKVMGQFEEKNTTNAELPRLARKQFRDIQRYTEMLDPREIAEQYALGILINERLVELTGKSYNELSPLRIAHLAFADMDFMERAAALKKKYETPDNRVVSRRTAKIFSEAASRKGRGAEIPAPGSPWHGPLFRPYASSASAP